jgi:uncharacterized protein with FMN-binding domain
MAGLTPGHSPTGVTVVSAAPPSRSGSSSRVPAAHAGEAGRQPPSSPGSRPGKRQSPSAAPPAQTVDGAVVSTPYGNVQVRLIHAGPRITDVRALQLTDSSQHSVSISAYAAPILRREAISAQSGQIDVVSGATYTSEGYQTSLQAAIDAAHL